MPLRLATYSPPTTTARAGTSADRRRIRLRDACDLAGLDGVSTHSFRRSFATNLHRQGYSLAKIARLLDHTSPTMTARYVE